MKNYTSDHDAESSSFSNLASPISTPRRETRSPSNLPSAPSRVHPTESRLVQTHGVSRELMRVSEAEFTQLTKQIEEKRKELKRLKEEVSKIEKDKQTKDLELQELIKKIQSTKSEEADSSRKALAFYGILVQLEEKKLVQKKRRRS